MKELGSPVCVLLNGAATEDIEIPTPLRRVRTLIEIPFEILRETVLYKS